MDSNTEALKDSFKKPDQTPDQARGHTNENINVTGFTHPCSWLSCHKSPWRCEQGERCVLLLCFPRLQLAFVCVPTVTSAGLRTASGTRLDTRYDHLALTSKTSAYLQSLKFVYISKINVRIPFIVHYSLHSLNYLQLNFLSLYLTWCCHHHGWLLPSAYTWTGCWHPSLSRPLFSAAPVSPSSSPSFSRETLDASTQSFWKSKETV